MIGIKKQNSNSTTSRHLRPFSRFHSLSIVICLWSAHSSTYFLHLYASLEELVLSLIDVHRGKKCK
ncbi:hypothetical protein BSM4216_1201 [Bacillus smithii]|nr:hypothetical protein BSM4216_1201 [Bacillus smithii]